MSKYEKEVKEDGIDEERAREYWLQNIEFYQGKRLFLVLRFLEISRFLEKIPKKNIEKINSLLYQLLNYSICSIGIRSRNRFFFENS